MTVRTIATIVVLALIVPCAVVIVFVTCHYALLRDAAASSAQVGSLNVQEGDILYFSEAKASLFTKTICAVKSTCFLHTAVVVRIPGRLELSLVHFTDPRDDRFFRPEPLCCGVKGSLSSSAIDTVFASYGRGALITVFRPRHPADPNLFDHCLAVGCPRLYDTDYVSTCLKSLFARDLHPARLQCNTFIGFLAERLGSLPVSQNPTMDYVPGTMYRLLARSEYYERPFIVMLE